tara:strand:- start:16474 stop:16830 length:357 start_codon:yes stop_codon:yes gene_type:complete
MKRYGKQLKYDRRKYKCGYAECGICSNAGWKVSKTRERHDTKVEDNTILDPEPTEFIEIENQVGIKQYYHTDGKEWFNATYVPLGISVNGVTPEHALGKVSMEFYEYYEDGIETGLPY